MARVVVIMEQSESDDSSTSERASEDDEDLPPRKKQELEVLSSQSTSTLSSSKQSRKFNASWLRGRKQWLVYKPEAGMYCSLCQKYDQRPYNRDVWNKQPCSRLHLQSIKRHESSAAHGQSLRMERNASKVQTLPIVVRPPLPAKGMEQAFSCLYFLTKQRIAHTTNYEPLLDLMSYLGVKIKEEIGKGMNATYKLFKKWCLLRPKYWKRK